MSGSNKMKDESIIPKQAAIRFIKMYKIELILMTLVILSGVVYIVINAKNDRREFELMKESKRVYSLAADIESDSADLTDTLYNDYNIVNKDIYFKYQIKNIGDTVSYYEMADKTSNERIKGRLNLTVTGVEKPEECFLIERVPGGAFIKLNIKVENLMAEDCIICVNNWRFLIMDDEGYEVYKPEYELDYLEVGPKLEECGDKLDCYLFYFDNAGAVQYDPVELNSHGMQYLLIEKGETITFNIYHEIPEKILNDSRLVFSNGAAIRGSEYNNRGFSIYINK